MNKDISCSVTEFSLIGKGFYVAAPGPRNILIHSKNIFEGEIILADIDIDIYILYWIILRQGQLIISITGRLSIQDDGLLHLLHPFYHVVFMLLTPLASLYSKK